VVGLTSFAEPKALTQPLLVVAALAGLTSFAEPKALTQPLLVVAAAQAAQV
jgi:hypothetical protein